MFNGPKSKEQKKVFMARANIIFHFFIQSLYRVKFLFVYTLCPWHFSCFWSIFFCFILRGLVVKCLCLKMKIIKKNKLKISSTTRLLETLETIFKFYRLMQTLKGKLFYGIFFIKNFYPLIFFHF